MPPFAIDQPSTFFHFLDLRRPDQPFGFRSQRRMNGQVINFRQHFVDRVDLIDSQFRRSFVGKKWIVANQVHAECFGTFGDFESNSTKADDPQSSSH